MAANVLNTVTNLVTNVLSTTAKVTHLGELPGLTGRIPIEVLLVGHCLAVASITKGRFGGKLLNFVQGFLMAFGGSVASNLFLGNPTSNVLFQNNQVVLIWAASWWLINHQPLDVINNLFDLQPVGIFARVGYRCLAAHMCI